MQNTATIQREGGAVRLTRIVAGIGALIALSLAVTASSASATTVYNYVYSGSYFDGSGAGKQFDVRVGGIEYDRANHIFYIGDSSQGYEHGIPGWVTKITPAGAGVNFAATGTPQIYSPRNPLLPEFELIFPFSEPSLTLDQTGGPDDGNLYATGGGRIYGWDEEGNPIPGFESDQSEGGMGITTLSDGNLFANAGGRGTNALISPEGALLASYHAGSPGLDPSVNGKWSESGTLLRVVADSEDSIYGIKAGTEIGFENTNGVGKLIKADAKAKEKYEVNEFERSFTPNQATRGIAVDLSNDSVFDVRGNNTFESYDKEGRLLGGGWGGPDAGHSYLGLSGEPIGIAVDPANHDVWIANRRDYGGEVAPYREIRSDRTSHHPEKHRDHPGLQRPDREHDRPPWDDQSRQRRHDRLSLRIRHQPETGHQRALPGQRRPTSIIGGTGDVEVDQRPDRRQTRHPLLVQGLLEKRQQPGRAEQHAELHPAGETDRRHDGRRPDQHRRRPAQHRIQPERRQRQRPLRVRRQGRAAGPVDAGDRRPSASRRRTKTSRAPPNTNRASTKNQLVVTGLTPDTPYEYRAVVTNEAGVTNSPIGEFRTYPPDAGTDPCANVQVRKQTGSGAAARLPRLRARLGGQRRRLRRRVRHRARPGAARRLPAGDGQPPLLPPLRRRSRASPGSPTNLGLDPYIARRGGRRLAAPNTSACRRTGWTTKAPSAHRCWARTPPCTSSPSAAATSAIRATPTARPTSRCASPTGSSSRAWRDRSNPAGNPAGRVAQPFSADGNHFVFGSTAEFEAAGDAGGSIYDRNLSTNTTQVVSTLPGGATITGGEVGELDISGDGSRIVVGKRISTGPTGNEYWHLYMHIGNVAELVRPDPGGDRRAPSTTA